jgi:hypothetical protein
VYETEPSVVVDANDVGKACRAVFDVAAEIGAIGATGNPFTSVAVTTSVINSPAEYSVLANAAFTVVAVVDESVTTAVVLIVAAVAKFEIVSVNLPNLAETPITPTDAVPAVASAADEVVAV